MSKQPRAAPIVDNTGWISLTDIATGTRIRLQASHISHYVAYTFQHPEGGPILPCTLLSLSSNSTITASETPEQVDQILSVV